ncbi:MFS transporter [Paenibacillus sp. OAS669]|uniref:MFS transporter n=1 Tax=Paenibacillus sp. OAS669 TaxID=2663821 RepID=UPI001CEF3D7B|nr:MFS transporter [Paenibacillus sp. OAS669]
MTNSFRCNFGLLWGSHFLSVLSSMVIAPLMPFYMEQLGAGDQAAVLLWSGLGLTAPAVSAALTAPLWGRLGDVTSRKWMVIRALGSSACVLAAMGLANTPFQLFLLRFLQGALGGVVDAVGAFAASQAGKEEQGKARGKLEGALAAGSMLGPLLGGVLMGAIGFRYILHSLAILLALWTILCAFLLKERQSEKRTAAVTQTGITAPLRGLLHKRELRLFLLAGITANFGIFGLLPVLPLHLKPYIGTSAQTAVWVGILQAVLWAAVWLTSSWWGRRNDVSPVHRNYALAAALCGVAIVLQALAPGMEWLVSSRVVQGAASSALVQSVFLVVTRSAPEGELGTRLGFTRSILFTGQIAGPMTSGLLGTMLTTSGLFVLHGAAIAAGGLLVGLFASPKLARRGVEDIPGCGHRPLPNEK